MSEAESHVLKQRMLAGKRAKAQRGELGMQVPMGYMRRPAGDVDKDPDEQAQAVIQLIFEQCERHMTIGGVLRYCVRHGIQLPYRIASGPATAQVQGVLAGYGEFLCNNSSIKGIGNLIS